MALVRFRPISEMEPFRDLGDIQHEMNRLFDTFFGRPGEPSGRERVWAPAVDMYETKDELVITAELPGLNEKDIHLSITGDMLTLRGERHWDQEVKQDNYYRGERWFGKFERALPLPVPVQADKVKATYRDGVLTVKLPKVEEIKPKEIKIDMA
ncbi:MAG TPA: Hsp20/alpha crystallin family protein [Methylomirabilota bacterium]|jgi:HSP20 family protein|nr:Hsp20/alpha crystallin family protein [Methylomirabilota bacterium]